MSLPSLSRLPVPAFIVMCLLIGGSIQWPIATMAIQLCAVALLVWALLGTRQSEHRAEGLSPVLLCVAVIALGMVQIIPLPPTIWSLIPGKDMIELGYAQLGNALPWLALSVDPEATVAALLTLLVPLAIYLAILRREAPSATILIGSILLGVTIGALVGIVQAFDKTTRYYPYAVSDWNSASGLFANPNHMGLMLLVAIPLAMGLGAEQWRTLRSRHLRIAVMAQLAAVAIALAAVIPFNHSLAMVLLGPPVVISSLLIPDWGKREHLRRATTLLLTFTIGAAVLAVFLFRNALESMGQTGFATRSEIWRSAWSQVTASFPFGTGLGTFERVYPLGENPYLVETTYVNHAHNDYLELLIEGGLPLVAILCLFLAWWLRRAKSDWLGKDHPEIGRAAAVASAAILAHSFVDFPLRTPAIAAVFAACLAMMVVAIRPLPIRNPRDLHETRHVVVR